MQNLKIKPLLIYLKNQPERGGRVSTRFFKNSTMKTNKNLAFKQKKGV